MSHLKNTLARITGKAIALTSAASTKIGTTTGKNFHPLFLVVAITAQTGLFVSVASLSCGTNATNYDDITAITALTGLNAAAKLLNTSIVGVVGIVAPNTDIYVKVTAAAVVTTQVADISLIGYYE
jgi:hypothetical protein